MARKNNQIKLYVPPPIDPGLFYWDTDLSEAARKEITAWYRSLSPEHRNMVDELRHEAREETEYQLRDDYNWNYGE